MIEFDEQIEEDDLGARAVIINLPPFSFSNITSPGRPLFHSRQAGFARAVIRVTGSSSADGFSVANAMILTVRSRLPLARIPLPPRDNRVRLESGVDIDSWRSDAPPTFPVF